MPPPPEIIDLLSDSEDEAPPPAAAARGRQFPNHQRDHFAAAEPNHDILADLFPDMSPLNDLALPAMGDLINVPLVIDDFDYLEEDDPPLDQEATTDPPEESDVEQPPIPDAEPVLSQEDCLSRVYDLFPDICPEHATRICSRAGQNSLLTPAALLDQVVEKLLADNTYPKRKKEAQNLKRKREESVNHGFERWERENREALPHNVATHIRSILKADFPNFTIASINKVIAEEKYLFKSYVRLASFRDTDVTVRRGRPSKVHFDDASIATSWPELVEELAAARRKAQANTDLRLVEKQNQMAEDQNTARAIATGETAECQACFDDLPTNRQIHCHGETPHFTCFPCIKTYISSEIGDARCRVLCTAGCGAGFEPAQLNRVDDKRLLENLADLQQEQDIRDAGLEDLEECPFCDYKAIMPPVEEDFEFRCANPECEKVSCRRCKALTHIPISCEQHAKNQKACSRHTIEEAMTAALLRSCNNCKKQFIKEYGCNKMTCPSCKNVQCYVCSETLKGYDHFDQHPGGGARAGGKCPLYDNLEERHEREVQAAKEKATALVIAQNPDVVPGDLEIKVSDAVKKATERQIRREAFPRLSTREPTTSHNPHCRRSSNRHQLS
jgi:TRIAD3 protein (E3 ubiquitin-protein ligase RNF216)